MRTLIYALLAAFALVVGVACQEGSEIGNSLAVESVSVIVDSSFTVSGKSVRNNVVQSRTVSQLIGRLEALGYGSIKSDFVGQLMPSLVIDTAGITADDIDSVKVFMQMTKGNFVGDSLVPMGLGIYRLTSELPYPIYSDFNVEGSYDKNELAGCVYTASVFNEPDSVSELASIYCSMPLPLSLGKELYNAYLRNPGIYADPALFAKDVFRGLYIRSTYGSGRISDFTTTSLRYYYHRNEWNEDSARYELVKYVGDYFAVTPEVVVNNNISYTPAQQIEAKVAAGENLIVAPAGYEVELRFPAPEIVASYNAYSNRVRVLNTVTMKLPVELLDNEYNIAPPPYVLLVRKDKKDEFFAKNQLTDNVTSFYAAYNSSTMSYDFTAMRPYVLDLLKKESLSEDDYTFILTPVQINTESAGSSYSYSYSSSEVISSIVPYVTKPAMAKILVDKAKIKLTFSAENNNNL